MASGRLADYLGRGLASARPAAPDLQSQSIGIWYSTDTGDLDLWDGSTWQTIANIGPGAIIGNEPSGGWSDGALLAYDAAQQVWVEVPPGTDGQVLRIVSGAPDWDDENPGGLSLPSSTTDNALVRWGGTGGDAQENSGVLVSDDDEISGYRGLVDRETAASYTFVLGDSGRIKELEDASGVDAVLDRDMPKGFACTVVQAGAGTINFRPETGATLVNRQSHTDSAGQWAGCTLYVSENAGSAAVWVLGGDTA
jgi:hypothetical protein